jgi:hypothetical protein
VATRARNANGRLIHFKVNPDRVAITCVICGKVVMKCKSDLRPGQQTTACSPSCACLARILWDPFDRQRVPKTNGLHQPFLREWSHTLCASFVSVS